MDEFIAVMAMSATFLIALGVGLGLVANFMLICPPNELLVVAGRTSYRRDGTRIGYRIVAGGRALRIPFVESVSRMQRNAMPLELELRRQLCKGEHRVDLELVGVVRICSDIGLVHSAIERFLGQDPAEIVEVAKNTLEGHAREALSSRRPEELNADRLAFSEDLVAAANVDMNKLGIELLTCNVRRLDCQEAGAD